MLTKAERQQRFEQVDLYPVITGDFCAGRSSLEVCQQVIAGGAKIVQLREKNLSKKALFFLAQGYRQLTQAAEVLLIINDHLDIALAVEADGVHLGQDDLPLAAAKRLAPEILIGLSTHSLAEAKQAQEQQADYVNLGPIFSTPTKGITRKSALGPEVISEVGPQLKIPFTIMGGIQLGNLAAVLQQGARRIAMITGVTQAPDIAARVKELRQRIAAGG